MPPPAAAELVGRCLTVAIGAHPSAPTAGRAGLTSDEGEISALDHIGRGGPP